MKARYVLEFDNRKFYVRWIRNRLKRWFPYKACMIPRSTIPIGIAGDQSAGPDMSLACASSSTRTFGVLRCINLNP